jgi:hypothetical protein
VALAVFDRPEQRLAEEPQRIGVLQRQQQLEGAEVAVGRDTAHRLRAVGRAVLGQRAELARLERAARLVVGLARAAGAHGAPRAGGRRRADRLAGGGDRALGQLEELVVEEPR